MPKPIIEVYSSIECPYAYLAVYRLRQVWAEYAGRVEIVWRTLSLEYINKRTSPKPREEAEAELFQQLEPGLPFKRWSRPEWQYPATMWPAFEALACAQAQGHDFAFEMSWALRRGLFADDRNLASRYELFAIAETVGLDMAAFELDWDSGRFKKSVIDDSKRGWHELNVKGSATFILPNDEQHTNPAIGKVDIDSANYVINGYAPYGGDALTAYRNMLDSAIQAAE